MNDRNIYFQVCMNGRNIFMGYLNMEDKTKEAFDEEGWLRSGDIGRKDGDGYLYITGRIKGAFCCVVEYLSLMKCCWALNDFSKVGVLMSYNCDILNRSKIE